MVTAALRVARVSIVPIALAAGCLGARPQALEPTDAGNATTSTGGQGGTGDAGASGTSGFGAQDAQGGAPAGGTSGDASTCPEGQDCSMPCQIAAIDCAGGVATCKLIRNAGDGTECGGGKFCLDGQCGGCRDGATCTNPAAPCRKGRVSCTQGFACVDTGENVTCAAIDECHQAGTCDPASGCSNPLQPDDTPCGGNGVCTSGACACKTPEIPCDGQCVVTSQNSKHCGTCNRDCRSGGCSIGQCQPWIILPSDPPASFAADGADLVWLPREGGKARKVAAEGSSLTTTLAVTGGTPARIALAGDVAVWTRIETSGLVSVWKNPKDVASSEIFPTVTVGSPGHSHTPIGLSLDATASTAYFLLADETGAATVQACTLGAGASCRSLGTLNASPLGEDIVLGTGYLFWTEAARGRVVRYSLSDSTTTDVVVGQHSPYALTVDSRYVYWADRSNGNFTIARTLQANPDPDHPGLVLTATAGTLTTLATDGKNVYYSGSFGRDDTIGYVPVTGGAGHPLFQDPGHQVAPAGFLAVANGAVYYYSFGGQNFQAIVTR